MLNLCDAMFCCDMLCYAILHKAYMHTDICAYMHTYMHTYMCTGVYVFISCLVGYVMLCFAALCCTVHCIHAYWHTQIITYIHTCMHTCTRTFVCYCVVCMQLCRYVFISTILRPILHPWGSGTIYRLQAPKQVLFVYFEPQGMSCPVCLFFSCRLQAVHHCLRSSAGARRDMGGGP